MHNIHILFFVLSCLFLLSSCESVNSSNGVVNSPSTSLDYSRWASDPTGESAKQVTHSPFTAENIMKVRVGMEPDEVLALFGEPDGIESTICGTEIDQPWRCLIWKYHFGLTFFIFSEEGESYMLNSFNINRF